MAQTLDSPPALKTVLNIFSDDAGDYYELDATLPCAAGGDEIENYV